MLQNQSYVKIVEALGTLSTTPFNMHVSPALKRVVSYKRSFIIYKICTYIIPRFFYNRYTMGMSICWRFLFPLVFSFLRPLNRIIGSNSSAGNPLIWRISFVNNKNSLTKLSDFYVLKTVLVVKHNLWIVNRGQTGRSDNGIK